MKTYTKTFTAGERYVLNVPGNYVHLISASNPIDIEAIDVGGRAQGEKAESVEAGTWFEMEAGKVFSAIVLTSATAQTIKIAIAFGRAGVFRVAGEVSVIDGGKARTIAGTAFLGWAGIAGVAAQFGHAQLLNPVGTGKRAVIRQIVATANGNCSMEVIRYDTALTTLIGNAPSKDVGGSPSSCELRAQTNAAQLGTGSFFFKEYTAANLTPAPIVFGEPIVLRPGRGILLRSDTVNLITNASFEFFEELDT